jgi:membrane associated rhomboid family serine protease
MQLDLDKVIWIFMWVAAGIGFLFFLIGLFVKSVGADASITGLLTTVISLGFLEIKARLLTQKEGEEKKKKSERCC